MQDHDFAPGHRNVDASGDTFGRFGAKLPKLAFKMFDMRRPQIVQANILDSFQKTEETRLKTGRQRLNFLIDGLMGLNRPYHLCYIAHLR
ncbi:Hypothetical protein NGAL_HAMBI2427_20950 [Neorhizobium galegae bv. orientalis]|uniref:Uncharacterized protein n=1 Tax=Neorhizobium galegae bv. orientalis str. HAMBI 540 TaxID=1028800 RepID=A0A068SWI1_NEOGA|nr:Hypothetical protein RG540_CH32110 [Neorhizobium galegae bv. orientalis str. HAMBI 540]CDZ47270.1 Hypothetical protein NGAL_HAMBI2427_20950 [Neorhizobium galegae bv. orientalis]